MERVIVLIGCGAIGSASAPQLAGLGKLRIIDRDVVERKNLGAGRFTEADVGQAKAAAVAGRLEQNGFFAESFVAELNSETVSLLEGAAVIVDGTDNMETRLLINDWCVKNRVPWVYGGALRAEGAGAVFLGRPCFRCVFPAGGGETCETAGVDRRTVEQVAGWQAEQVNGVLEGKRRNGLFLTVNGERGEELEIERSEGCECCEKRTFPFLEQKPARVRELCGSGFLVDAGRGVVEKFFEKEGKKEVVTITKGAAELVVFRNGRVLVRGVANAAEALAVLMGI